MLGTCRVYIVGQGAGNVQKRCYVASKLTLIELFVSVRLSDNYYLKSHADYTGKAC